MWQRIGARGPRDEEWFLSKEREEHGTLVVKRPCRGYHRGRARRELSASSPRGAPGPGSRLARIARPHGA